MTNNGENLDGLVPSLASDGLNGNDESIDYHVTEDILSDSKAIIDSSQRIARRAVNISLVLRNWFLGKRIVEEELRGATRSELYGRELIVKLADELNAAYGKGFGKSSLYQYVKFYRLFPEIFHGNRGKSPGLTWTHYRHGTSFAWKTLKPALGTKQRHLEMLRAHRLESEDHNAPGCGADGHVRAHVRRAKARRW